MSQTNAENSLAEGSGCSKSIIEITDACCHYVVMGYSSTRGMGVGKYLCSDSFKAGGLDWTIRFYPEGYDKDNSNYASVYLALAPKGTDVTAQLEFTLVDQSGKGRHRVRRDRCIFDRKVHKWGFKTFITRSTLETAGYLKDDCLLLHCKVDAVKNGVEGPRKDTMIPVLPPSDMGQALMSMLDCRVGCDVVFHVEDETFEAHKAVLAARSPVFMAQFFEHDGDPNMDKVVVIQDLKPSVFKAMITFIYSDELPDPYKNAVSSETMIRHLLSAAERYGLARLKLLCEAKLCEKFIGDTVCSSNSNMVETLGERGICGAEPERLHRYETCCSGEVKKTTRQL